MIKQSSLFLALFLAVSTAVSAPKIPNDLVSHSLVYCTTMSSFSFNPQKADVGANMNVVTEQIYDKLLEFDPQTNQIKPALAEYFEISDDGLLITFHLRKNVAFHETKWFTPTRFLNAEDVVFSLHRVMGDVSDLPALNTPESEQLQSFAFKKIADQTHFPYFESIDFKGKIKSIHAINPLTVQIRLAKPDHAMLAHLASQYAVILSKEYALQLNADENLAQLDLLPVGTGVYQLAHYAPNNAIRLAPNPNYWGEKAKIANMVVDFSSDSTGRMAKFLNQECDVVAFPEPSQLYAFGLKQGKTVENRGANLAFLAFNFERPKMQDIGLRRKIAGAIDRSRIARTLFHGTAEEAYFAVPNVLTKLENHGGYPYSPANNENEKVTGTTERLRLWVLDEKRVYNPHPMKMAELIRADLAQIGLNVEIKMVSRAYLVQQLANKKADYDLILGGWLANNFDIESFLSPILGCRMQNQVTNLSNWCDPQFDYWLQAMRFSEQPADRQMIYRFIQSQLEENLPFLPLVNVNRILAVNPRVENVAISPFGEVKLSEITLK